MQQRQPRLGDILDDYCPRERRLTNHVVVAMVGDTVKQTRCTTCDADHEYKHAAVPKQRKKDESALYSQVLAAVTPRKVVLPREVIAEPVDMPAPPPPPRPAPVPPPRMASGAADFEALFQPAEPPDASGTDKPVEEGPLHRRLIRAQLPRHEGQAAVTRQAPDFTIRQPNPGRPKRFGGARPLRGGVTPMQGNRQGGNGNGNVAGNGHGNTRGAQRHAGRPAGGARPGGSRPGGGRNRSK